MKVFALRIAAGAVRVLAAFAGLFAPHRNHPGGSIVLISCQDDKPSQDILDLEKTLDAPYIHVLSGRMKRSPGGAILFAGRLFSMLRYIASARIVVIDSYCAAVCIPKKRSGQKVLQLWHAAEAIKKFSWQIVDKPAGYSRQVAEILCMHKNYDHILCPSAATRPFFSQSFGYPEDVFVKYGLPSLDRVGLMRRPAAGNGESPERLETRDLIKARYPELRERPLTIVYAPTFRDGATADAEGFVRGVLSVYEGLGAGENELKITLVVKLHPFEATWFAAPPGLPVLQDAEFSLIEWYAAADVIVTDYSGIAIDAAAAGIASYYYIYDIEEYMAGRGLNVDIRKEAVGKYAYPDARELALQVFRDFGIGTQGTRDAAYDYEALKEFADKYLEVSLSGNTEALSAFIKSL